MPFTFSHPAIVLPLMFLPRKWVSLTGLVIGSLTPDFEYFIRMKVQSDYSHSISGLFWFDLPLGLLLAFIFHNIVRNSLFNNLPVVLKARLSAFQHFNWNEYFKFNWLVVVLSILIGASSHLFWDSFTHEHGYFVEVIPGLNNIVEIAGRPVPVFKILQHGSTLVGALIIAFSIGTLPADEHVSQQLNLKYWIVLTVIALVILLFRLLMGLNLKLFGHVFVTGISAVLISLVLTPQFVRQK